MKEVEILVEILDTKENTLEKLNKFNFVGEKEVLDIYFYNKKTNQFKPKELRLMECFRLRKKEDKNYLAYKKDYFDNKNIWTYSDEHETEIESFETMLKIISSIGFEPLIEIDNIKHTFLTDKYEIVLEEVKNLGLFLEVERLIVEDYEEILKVKEEIFEFIKALNVKVSPELNMGKPELMLRKNKIK